MKKLLLFLFCAGILTSFNANAFFFFFIPTGAIADLLSGAKGDTCINNTHQVGDIITSESGSTAKILSISGTSSRCPNSLLPIRAEIEYNLKFNSKLGFDLPDNVSGDFRPGFVKKDLTPTDYFSGKLYFGSRSNPESYIQFSTRKKTRSLDEEMKIVIARQAQKSASNNSLEITNLNINGLNAQRVEVSLLLQNKTYIMIKTLIEGAEEFILVDEWCKADDFAEIKPYFIKIADSVKGLSESSISNKSNSEIVPVIQPAIQKPNVTAEPPTVNTTTKFENKVQPVNSEQSIGAKKLIELKSLLDKGLITQKDYDSKKTEILKSM